MRLRWFPRLRVQFMAPRRLDLPAELKGRRRRQKAGEALDDLMTDMIFPSSDYRRTLFQSLLDARTTHGGEHLAFEDIERRPLTYRKLSLACFVLGRALARGSRPGERVGLLLPGLTYRLTGRQRDPDAEAVILFTSGTEGAPKGVALTHVNPQANRLQVASRIDFGPTDIVFNALPMFHSFGLTCGTILPVLSGIKVFLYPSPLHYRIVPTLASDTDATLMFGTDTFLAGYARFAHPYDFYSMRYVFAGAEKVKEETRRIWSERFGCRLFEGYGATQTAPVLSMNSPMQNRSGSVERLMPGIEHRIGALTGIETRGKLLVRGPNVMKGFLTVDEPGVVKPPAQGWYDTEDIVDIDAEGFVYIKGRAKRFAKIGDEMVSLPAVEELAEALWPGHRHAAVTLPDPRKGEQPVLITDCGAATREAPTACGKSQGAAEISLPKTLLVVEAVPLLGTGKTDYRAVRTLAEKRAQAQRAARG